MTRIDTFDRWYAFAELMRKHGYFLLWRQYRVTDPEGSIAGFRSSDPALRDIEVVTFDAGVDKAIGAYQG